MRNSKTRNENRRKEEKQKKVGDYYCPGMGLDEDTTQSTLNKGTRGNQTKKIGNGLTIQGSKKKIECKRCKRTDHFIKCKKCPYHKDYESPLGTDSFTDTQEVAVMKLAYPNGMHLNQVGDVNEVTFVDTTVDDEGELNTGKWNNKM